MARSHSRTVIDAMITALRAIATTSGDSFTPAVVQRRDDDRSVEGAAESILVWVQAMSRRLDGASIWLVDLSVVIRVVLFTGPSTADASDEIIEEAAEDVWRALNAMDLSALPAHLESFTSTSFQELDDEHPVAGFDAVVEVRYEIDFNNPDTVLDPR
jgi:hypothetical protein